jgi:hypothetical protein
MEILSTTMSERMFPSNGSPSEYSMFQYAKYNSSFSAAHCFCLALSELLKCYTSCDSCSGTVSNQRVDCSEDGKCALPLFFMHGVYNWSTSSPIIGRQSLDYQWGGCISGVAQGSCSPSGFAFGYYDFYNQGVYTTALGLSYRTNISLIPPSCCSLTTGQKRYERAFSSRRRV